MYCFLLWLLLPILCLIFRTVSAPINHGMIGTENLPMGDIAASRQLYSAQLTEALLFCLSCSLRILAALFCFVSSTWHSLRIHRRKKTLIKKKKDFLICQLLQTLWFLLHSLGKLFGLQIKIILLKIGTHVIFKFLYMCRYNYLKS